VHGPLGEKAAPELWAEQRMTSMAYQGPRSPNTRKELAEEARLLLRALDLWLRTEGLASSSGTLRTALRARKRLQATLARTRRRG
jgi:hypothetical protein